MAELSDEDLRRRLILRGFNAPPVIGANRQILINHLRRLEEQQPNPSSSYSAKKADNEDNSQKTYSLLERPSPSAASSNVEHVSVTTEELSDDELRRRLISLGFSTPPPVNKATRPMLLRKLYRLEQQQQQNPERVPGKQSSPPRTRRTISRYISGGDEGDGETSSRSVAYDTPSLGTSDRQRRVDFGAEHSPYDSAESFRVPQYTSPTKRLMEIRDSLSSANPMLSTPTGPIEPIYKDRCQPRSILKRRESIKKRMMNFLDPSSLMLAVFLAFFAILVFFYYYNDSADRGTGLKDLSMFECTAIPGYDKRPMIDCLEKSAAETTIKVLDHVYRKLHDAAVDAYCSGRSEEAIVSDRDIMEFLITKPVDLLHEEANKALVGIKFVANFYRRLGIRVMDDGLMIENPIVPWSCALKTNLTNCFTYFVRFVAVAVLVILPMFVYMVVKIKRQTKQKEIQQLINGVIDILQKNAAQNPAANYLPIQDIRIRLIPANEIQKKQKLWEEVEKLLEATDPRIRREIHASGGEEHHVWRWLPQDLPPPPAPTTSKLQKKTWQGEAFVTTKGTMNSPNVSPTECLKIRNMFDAKTEGNSTDWILELQDAILKRCEEAKILHIGVEKDNLEGCVYVKCATAEDAGMAYRKMHGVWFDGKLVSVKYIRLERYHERFPESINLRKPLFLSKN